jgi:Type I phosphodiesterase / nucleotide pyrophosphatase
MTSRQIPGRTIGIAAAIPMLVLLGCTERTTTAPAAPAASIAGATVAFSEDAEAGARQSRIKHVLLISIDGMRQSDLARFVRSHPASTLGGLVRHGVSFTNATASKPSDSFLGLLAQITGGSPKATGVYYDNSYDRELFAPGSACAGAKGTEVVYDESIDCNSNALDAGGGIDPAALPLQKKNGICAPVYPHQFLRVNTIFEVAKAAGMLTAWADKHQAYDIANGPSGHGLDDLYTPEIASGAYEDNAAHAATYDAIKVEAVLREIDGKRHDGTGNPGVPAVFGMNFQAVSVGEKTAGYLDAAGTPTPSLETALEFVDRSLARMVAEIEREHLSGSTVIIVSAKHGQSPIDQASDASSMRTFCPTWSTALSQGWSQRAPRTTSLSFGLRTARAQRTRQTLSSQTRERSASLPFYRGARSPRCSAIRLLIVAYRTWSPSYSTG